MLWQVSSLAWLFLSHTADKIRRSSRRNQNFRRQLLRAQCDDVPQQSMLVKTALYPAINKLDKCYPQTPFKNS